MAFTTTTILAIGGLALGVGSLGLTAYGMKQQDKAGRRLEEAQRRQQEVATRRSRRSAIRERAIRSAEVVAAANAFGAGASTGLEGSVGSLGSQLGSGLGFSTEMSNISRDIGSASTSLRRGQAISNFGFSLFNASGGFSGLYNSYDKLVNQPATTPTPRASLGMGGSGEG